MTFSSPFQEKRNVKNDRKEKIMLKINLIDEQLGLPGYFSLQKKQTTLFSPICFSNSRTRLSHEKNSFSCVQWEHLSCVSLPKSPKMKYTKSLDADLLFLLSFSLLPECRDGTVFAFYVIFRL